MNNWMVLKKEHTEYWGIHPFLDEVLFIKTTKPSECVGNWASVYFRENIQHFTSIFTN